MSTSTTSKSKTGLEPNATYEKKYIERMTSNVDKIIRHMDQFYQEINDVSDEISRTVTDFDPCEIKLSLDSMLKLDQKLFLMKTRLCSNLRCVIYFVEMKNPPFLSSSTSTTQISSLCSAIISLLTQNLTSLHEMNLFQDVENEQKVLKEAPYHPDMFRNLVIEHAGTLDRNLLKFGYILHSISKAIHAVKNISNNYRDNTDNPPPSMYTSSSMYT